MEEVMRDAKRVEPVTRESYSEVRCEQCRLGDSESELVLCDGCDKGFHIYCLRPIVVRVPTGSWFCPECQDSKPLKSKR
jgi:[histone H3]-lysine27 N-methyltransferase